MAERTVLGTNNRGPGHPFEVSTSRTSVEPGLPDVHPGMDARASTHIRGHDLPAYAGSRGMESDFERCKQCGYIFDRITVSPGSGYGNIQAEPIILAGNIVDPNAKNPMVGSGCPFCGSSNYEDGLANDPDEHEGTGYESEGSPGGY